jgi:hypothetical protein
VPPALVFQLDKRNAVTTPASRLSPSPLPRKLSSYVDGSLLPEVISVQ